MKSITQFIYESYQKTTIKDGLANIVKNGGKIRFKHDGNDEDDEITIGYLGDKTFEFALILNDRFTTIKVDVKTNPKTMDPYDLYTEIEYLLEKKTGIYIGDNEIKVEILPMAKK